MKSLRSICCSALLLLPCLLSAQINLHVQKNKPHRPHEFTWFCNPYDDWRLELYRVGKWDTIPAACNEAPRVWHGFLLVIDAYKHRSLFKQNGTKLWEGAKYEFAKDSIVGAWDGNDNWIVLNMRGDTLVRFKEADPGPLKWVKIKGEQGVCFPKYETGYPDFWDVDIHNWGILGGNGQWLISPQYDAPFSFKGGFANVIYYGKERVINEKGEFVDP